VQVPLHCAVPALHTGWQLPSTHTWPAAQERPHAPQLTASLARLVHPLAQGTWVPVQPHTPITQAWPDGHARPHAPQLAALVAVLTHAPAHWVRPAPAGQAQLPLLQNCPAPQTVPQAPQLLALLARLTQLPPQLVWPRTQLARQRPKVHTWPAAQALPQAPQFVVDDWVLTHTPLHSTCAGVPPPGPPVAGAQPQRPLRQVAPPVQAMPQPPQLAASVVTFTQALPQRSSPGVQND